MANITYTVDSGWKNTPAATYTLGPNSYKWSAMVTFTVPGPNPAVLIVTDRNWVSELVLITDATGTTVSRAHGLWAAGQQPTTHAFPVPPVSASKVALSYPACAPAATHTRTHLAAAGAGVWQLH
jgi:hypothetical protein